MKCYLCDEEIINAEDMIMTGPEFVHKWCLEKQQEEARLE